MHQIGVFGSLVEAAHWESVVHLDRARLDFCTDALKLRMVRRQTLQFVPQRVEGGVADLRGRGVVVQVGMARDFLGEPRDARRIILRRAAHASPLGMRFFEASPQTSSPSRSAVNWLFSSGQRMAKAASMRRR